MNNKVVAVILFVLAAVMLVLGWVIQGLPPAVTGVGFAVIGYHILRSKP
jgi:xanthine/uracil permease